MYTVAIQGKVWGLVNLLYCLFILMRTYASRLTNDCTTSTVTLQMALHPNPRRTQNASEKKKKKNLPLHIWPVNMEKLSGIYVFAIFKKVWETWLEHKFFFLKRQTYISSNLWKQDQTDPSVSHFARFPIPQCQLLLM